jgi:cold shock CspA family protein
MTPSQECDTQLGICKWFDKQKGYGFVQELHTENDLFVHYSQLQSNDGAQSRYLLAGEYISFVETEYTNPRNTTTPGTPTRTAGNVTGVGGGPLMYQTQLEQRSTYHPEEDGQHPGARTKPNDSFRKRKNVLPARATSPPESEKVFDANPFNLLASE